MLPAAERVSGGWRPVGRRAKQGILALRAQITEEKCMQVFDVTKVYGIYDKQPVGGKSLYRAPAVPKQDKLSLSGDARDFQAVMRGLKDAPDVRAGKVADIAGKYASGGHQAEPAAIAEALAKSGLFARK
jgi:hypothetical protein